MKVAYFWWADAAMYDNSPQEISDVKETYELARMFSAGILINETEAMGTLALDVQMNEETCRAVHTYPKVCFREFKVIDVKEGE